MPLIWFKLLKHISTDDRDTQKTAATVIQEPQSLPEESLQPKKKKCSD